VGQYARDYRNIGIMALCEAVFMSTALINVAVAGLAAQGMLEDNKYATLPQALIPLVSMLGALPASFAMKYIGRRRGFQLGALAGVVSGATSAAALLMKSFPLFLVGVGLLGLYHAFAAFYRFAVADNAPEAIRAKAISLTLAGGVLAAVIAPLLGGYASTRVSPVPFVGSYIAILGLNILAVLLLAMLRLPKPANEGRAPVRCDLSAVFGDIRILVAMLFCGLGGGLMMLVMAATPLAMLGCGFDVGQSSLVLSWHVAAMFIPFFFSGNLVTCMGLYRFMAVGVVLMAAASGVAISGIGELHFAVALVLSGLGWNFMYVGGSTLLASADTPETRALVQGVNELFSFAVMAIATFSSGLLYTAFGWNVLNMGAVVLCLVLLAGFLLMQRRRLQPA
jgi:MFS family permease